MVFINFWAGIEKNFDSRRLLCAWHIQRNFVSRFTNLAKVNSEFYHKILVLPFITNNEKFDSIVEEAINSEDLSEKEKDYLNLKLGSKHTWAKCFIKHRFGAGVNTTSRVEGLHKVIRSFLTTNSRLTEVFEVFRKIESQKLEKFQDEFNRHSKNIGTICTDCFLIKELSQTYSPYVIKKLEPKVSKALSFKCEEIIPGKTWYFLLLLNLLIRKIFHAFYENPNQYIVNKETQNILCQCKESIFEGVPCRHELALCLHILKDPKVLFFESRWKKDYCGIENQKENKEENKENIEKESEGDMGKRVKVSFSSDSNLDIGGKSYNQENPRKV